MLCSPAVNNAGDFLLDKEGKLIFDYLRLHIKNIWQSYHFFCMYANADKIKAKEQYSYTNILINILSASLYNMYHK